MGEKHMSENEILAVDYHEEKAPISTYHPDFRCVAGIGGQVTVQALPD